MNYGEQSSEHQTAVREVANARHDAIRSVSKLSSAPVQPHHRNLVPAADADNSAAVHATQLVVDYLIQLRPYRASAENWTANFGFVQLPRKIDNGRDAGQYGSPKDDILKIRQPPQIPLRNLSEVIQAGNRTIEFLGHSGGDFGSASEKVKSFKLVFPAETLYQFLGAADDVAAEMDLLAEIEPPDHDATGNGAV